MKTSETAVPDVAGSAVEGGTEHILLVDDEAAITRFVSQMLERLGYSVSSRTSSRKAPCHPAGHFDYHLHRIQ